MDDENEIQSDELSRDDLLAAVAEAGGANPDDVPTPADPAAPAAPGAGEAPALDPEEPRIAAILRAREDAAKKRFDAEDYATRLRREADEEVARIRAEAKKAAEEEWAAEVAAKRKRFQENPTEAVRALGDPDDIVNAVVREGSPEWKAIRAAEERAAKAEAKASEVDSVKSEFQQWKKAQEDEKQQALVERIKTEFLSQHASEEKLPYTYARYDSAEEVFQKANQLAMEWQKGGLKLGVDFDRNDVAEYLEAQSKKKLSSLGIAPQQAGGAAAKAAGNAPKVSANGSRTLSAATGSERRTSPKPVSEMTPDEERAALIAAASEARRTTK